MFSSSRVAEEKQWCPYLRYYMEFLEQGFEEVDNDEQLHALSKRTPINACYRDTPTAIGCAAGATFTIYNL